MKESTPPLVTVIIPFHDRFELVERAIASVLTQTHRPLQVVAVDDASAEPFEFDPHLLPERTSLEIVRLASNSGPGTSREAGRLHAKGEFIAYLDSDDYWDRRFLASCVQALQDHSEAGMAYCRAMDVENGRVTGVSKRSDRRFDRPLPALFSGRPWPTGGCLWRRELTDRMGPWLPLWQWEDYAYDFRAGVLGATLAYVPEPLCFVQRDALARQSYVKWNDKSVASVAAGVLFISGELARTGWLRDPVARSTISGWLLSVARTGAERGDVGIAKRALYMARHWSDRPLLLSAAAACMPLLIRVGQGSLAARTIAWVRHRLVPSLRLPSEALEEPQ